MCQADARHAFFVGGPGARKVTCIRNLFQATHFHKKGGQKEWKTKHGNKRSALKRKGKSVLAAAISTRSYAQIKIPARAVSGIFAASPAACTQKYENIKRRKKTNDRFKIR